MLTFQLLFTVYVIIVITVFILLLSCFLIIPFVVWGDSYFHSGFGWPLGAICTVARPELRLFSPRVKRFFVDETYRVMLTFSCSLWVWKWAYYFSSKISFNFSGRVTVQLITCKTLYVMLLVNMNCLWHITLLHW